MYHNMAGNSYGMLIFVIFMVNLAVTKLSTTKINSFTAVCTGIHDWILFTARDVAKNNIMEAVIHSTFHEISTPKITRHTVRCLVFTFYKYIFQVSSIPVISA
jgi:hypothetical protein